MKYKNKILKHLTIIGAIFAVLFVFNIIRAANNQGERIENVVEMPVAFERQFSRVIQQRRVKPVPVVNFLTPTGDIETLGDYAGQYLLVNFWATWCPPCVLELPSLEKLSNKMDSEALKVMAISIDTMRSQDQIKSFLDNRNIGDFAAYHDHESEIQRNIKMRGIPTTLLLNPNGEVIYVFEGDADWNSAPAIRFFKKLLNS